MSVSLLPPNSPAANTLELTALAARLSDVRLAERSRFARELERLRAAQDARAGDTTDALARLAQRIEASAAQVQRLRQLPLRVELDPALPISAHREEIRARLEAHSVIIVCGATGSGKSTQLPKLCLAAGRGARGLIGHTQPRRIAARALAARLAQELGTTLGGAVGYQVRFSDRTGRDGRVKLMTDGILLRELAHDRNLERYDTLIIDEAHERSVNIDLLLGVVRRLSARRPELRIIVTSATIDAERLAHFLGDAPIIEVSGRSFPIEVRYRPLAVADEDAAELSLPEAVVGAVQELSTQAHTARGDVLVFLPGEQHIREAHEALRRARLPDTDLVPLFARLSSAEHERIFQPHARRRVVLATNVAETSLTVPGVRHVIDSGLARISRYSLRGKIQRLPIEPISRASAEQRKGRCGREAEGVCIRLYSQDSFEERAAFTPPEILRTNLASVMLHMAVSGLGDMASFAFLDPPDARLVQDGARLLQELQAMDDAQRVTRIGRQIAALPCDPRLGRMLVAGAQQGCLSQMRVIVAFLAVPDPRERPPEAAQQADARHTAFADARSDFRMVLKLWNDFQRESAALSRAELRKWCRESFLSFVRMREWQDVHEELGEAALELWTPRDGGRRAGTRDAGYAQLHRAILSGFATSVGQLEERREYRAPRGARFVIAPGTPLASKPPRWVVAGSLVETTRVYARMVAAVEPAWIERAAAHLTRRHFSEPHWDAALGQVMAYETVALHDLALIARRRVCYGPVAPAEAHEIFVREALVAGRAPIEAAFLAANRALRASTERLEAKIRRRDILVDEQCEVDFYLARIPEAVNSLAAFERWLVGIERHEPQRLRMTSGDLMRRAAEDAGPQHFPDTLRIGASALPLEYVFDADRADDGVTLLVPQPLIDALEPERLAWHVPGLRLEKITELLRALPKALRRKLVPIPEQARAALAELLGPAADAAAAQQLPELAFHESLAQWITRRAGESVTAAELAALPLPEYLRLNMRIFAVSERADENPPRVLAQGRDARALKERLRDATIEHAASESPKRELHRRWDFGPLAERLTVTRSGVRYEVFPSLEAHAGGVAQVEARNPEEAQLLLRAAVARLAGLALPRELRELRRRIATDRELILLAQGCTLAQPLPDSISDRACSDCFVPQAAPLPRSQSELEALVAARSGELPATAERVIDTVRTVLRALRAVRAARERVGPRADPSALADIDAQLASLTPPDFIESTPQPWLEQLPRYLEALSRRLERLPGDLQRDARLAGQVAPFVRAWRELAAERVYGPELPGVQQLRWMLEEFRVSLFAQELKTLHPVSARRLEELVRRARGPGPRRDV